MKKIVLAMAVTVLFLSGCASVTMESAEKTAMAKQFNPPSDGKAGVYIYRSGSFGSAVKKSIWIDDNCIGESAPNIFFYEEVAGNNEHKFTTESEFSPNDLLVTTESGKNYFISQEIKFGVFVAGAKLAVVEEAKGKADVAKLGMAKKGQCN